MIDGLHQPGAEDLLAAVLGQVQEIVAGVGHGQVLLSTGRGLDDNAQAGHAVDGNAVTARQKHWENQREDWTVEAGDLHRGLHLKANSIPTHMAGHCLEESKRWLNSMQGTVGLLGGGVKEQRPEARALLGMQMSKWSGPLP